MVAATKDKDVKTKEIKGDDGQSHFDGMEPERVPELDAIAGKYLNEREKRRKAKEKEIEFKEDLSEAMEKANVPYYTLNGNAFELQKTKKLSIRKLKQAGED